MTDMTSVKNQTNTERSVDIDLEAQTLKVVVEEGKEKVNNKTTLTVEDGVVTDIIIVLDESSSMASMGEEPIQAANAFIQEQRKNAEDGSKITLVTFNKGITRIIDDQLLSEVKDLREDSYVPNGVTALNDAICTTIDNKLKSGKSDNVVLLIITDGEENSSTRFSTDNTKKRIEKVQKDHDWKVIFIGANIDVFAEGNKLNVDRDRCAQYDQNLPGNLLYLMRTTSEYVRDYRRSLSRGESVADLKVPQINTHKSWPINLSTCGHLSYPQPPNNGMMSPTLPGIHPVLTRKITGIGL